MNVQLSSLLLGYVSPRLNSLVLRVKSSRDANGTGPTHGPFPIAGDHMLSLATHMISLYWPSARKLGILLSRITFSM